MTPSIFYLTYVLVSFDSGCTSLSHLSICHFASSSPFGFGKQTEHLSMTYCNLLIHDRLVVSASMINMTLLWIFFAIGLCWTCSKMRLLPRALVLSGYLSPSVSLQKVFTFLGSSSFLLGKPVPPKKT